MSAFNDVSYLNNNGLQHLNDRLHSTFRVTAGQNDYANLGNFATSSGYYTNANGDYSYAEGYSTSSIGSFSHAEGLFTNAIGNYSHAEGQNTYANGEASHAEGYNTRSFGNYSHSEGNKSLANAEFSHAEGGSTIANGLYSHAEGSETTAFGHSAHAEGATTRSYGAGAHSEGRMTLASGDGAHAEGSSVVSASYSSSKGIISYANGSHAEGRVDGDTSFIKALGLGAHAEGYANLEGTGVNAYGVGSHAEGGSTGAIGDYSHAEGYQAYANGNYSHAEGYKAYANGNCSHAEGKDALANGIHSHAEGMHTKAYGCQSHAEGESTNAFGDSSHAEGSESNAIGYASHAEGSSTNAFGDSSHAEGCRTQALCFASHASGYRTIANSNYATVVGKYSNDSQDILFGVGNGTGTAARSSCFEITTDGFIRTGDTKIRFGVDANGNYGYIKPGADTVYPFSSGGGDLLLPAPVKYLIKLQTSVSDGNNYDYYLNTASPNFVINPRGSMYLYCHPRKDNNPQYFLENVINSNTKFFFYVTACFGGLNGVDGFYYPWINNFHNPYTMLDESPDLNYASIQNYVTNIKNANKPLLYNFGSPSYLIDGNIYVSWFGKNPSGGWSKYNSSNGNTNTAFASYIYNSTKILNEFPGVTFDNEIDNTNTYTLLRSFLNAGINFEKYYYMDLNNIKRVSIPSYTTSLAYANFRNSNNNANFENFQAKTNYGINFIEAGKNEKLNPILYYKGGSNISMLINFKFPWLNEVITNYVSCPSSEDNINNIFKFSQFSISAGFPLLYFIKPNIYDSTGINGVNMRNCNFSYCISAYIGVWND